MGAVAPEDCPAVGRHGRGVIALGAVGRTYLQIASDRRAFSSLERDGVTMLSPSVRVLAAATAALTQAVAGEAPDLSALKSALAGLESADNDLGLILKTRPLVTKLITRYDLTEVPV